MPRQPQPVPPIYQPEVAAEAIYHAAYHRQREMMVGWPSLAAIYGNRVFPNLLDRRLARTGYESQQTDEPVGPHRIDNLWEPAPGDRGAHGRFDGRAHSFSPQLWADTHRSWVAISATVFAAAAAIAWKLRRSASTAR